MRIREIAAEHLDFLKKQPRRNTIYVSSSDYGATGSLFYHADTSPGVVLQFDEDQWGFTVLPDDGLGSDSWRVTGMTEYME